MVKLTVAIVGKKQKKAIFEIIDLKVSLDMEKVLFEIQNTRKDIEHFEKRTNLQAKIFYFLFGLVITFMTALKLFS